MSASEKFFLKKKYLFWGVAIALLVLFLYKIRSVLLPFYLATFVVILFNGVVKFFNKKLHIPRAITSAIITILFCSFCVYFVYALFSLSFTKASTSVSNIKNNTDLINNITVYIGSWLKKFDIENTFNIIAGQFSESVVAYAKSLVSYILSYSSDIASTICLLVLSPIVMFMMLKDMPLIGKKFYDLLPKGIKKETKGLLNDIYESVFKYLEGQTTTAIVLSSLYALLLVFVDVEHFLILGIIIGFASFVPYIGFYSATAITLFSVYNQFHDLKRIIIVFVFMMIMQVIDSGFITPRIVGNKLGVHPLAVIFGVLVAVPLFGIFGVLLALPIIGVLNVIGKFVIKKYKASSYYNS